MTTPDLWRRGAALGIRILVSATIASLVLGLLTGALHTWLLALIEAGTRSPAREWLFAPGTVLHALSVLAQGAFLYGLWRLLRDPAAAPVASLTSGALFLRAIDTSVSVGYLIAPEVTYRLLGGDGATVALVAMDAVACVLLLLALARLTGRRFDGAMIGVVALLLGLEAVVWLSDRPPLRELLRGRAWAFFVLRQPLALAMKGLLLYVLARAGRDLALMPGDGPAPPPPARDDAASGQRLVLMGALSLAGGLIVTVASYLAASASASGGRYLVAYGAILYGISQIIRGFARIGR